MSNEIREAAVYAMVTDAVQQAFRDLSDEGNSISDPLELGQRAASNFQGSLKRRGYRVVLP